MISNGKATEGLVQHRIGEMAAEVLNSSSVLRLSFCTKLNICASIFRHIAKPKTVRL